MLLNWVNKKLKKKWLCIFILAAISTSFSFGRSSAVSNAARPRVTGIVVPHHAVALDLIEETFRCSANQDIKRIILLSPDHFRRSKTPFATTLEDFDTRNGSVISDKDAVNEILKNKDTSTSTLFSREHGVQILLPYIAKYFPKAKVLPIALRIESKKDQLVSLIDTLEPLITSETLIVQSTDFSHYLSHQQARYHDQQTMNTLALGRPESIFELKQPEHLDSKAAQFIHMELQRRKGAVGPIVLQNRNCQQYSPVLERETTSYITQVYHRPSEQEFIWNAGEDSETWIFAGDFFFGRYLRSFLHDQVKLEKLKDSILKKTQGRPMVVNLEGVLLPRVENPNSQRLLHMEQRPIIDFLRSINVKIVSLANNHAFDAGQSGLDYTANILRANGITPLLEGEVHDQGTFRITALSDLCNHRSPLGSRITPQIIENITDSNIRFPAFAFIHWGKEFDATPQTSQNRISSWLEATPISMIIGSHPHVSSENIQSWTGKDGLIIWSLGNFIFDQPMGNGALVEVRFFKNETYSTRRMNLGNLVYN